MAAAKKDVSRIVSAAQALESELERFRTSTETLLANRLDSGKQLERAAKQLESIASIDERLGGCVAELIAAIIEAREKQVASADQVRTFADSVGDRAQAFNELMGRYAALGNAAREVGEKMAPAGTDKTLSVLEDSVYVFGAADFGYTDASDTPANAFTGVRVAAVTGAGALTFDGSALAAGQTISIADIDSGKLVFRPGAGQLPLPGPANATAIRRRTGSRRQSRWPPRSVGWPTRLAQDPSVRESCG